MLDLNHPMTGHIFRASGLMDAAMRIGQEMTVAPSLPRRELLARALPIFREMRELNRQHFRDSPFIAGAIDEYEEGLRTLADLGDGRILEDRRDGERDCPYCGAAILKSCPLEESRTAYFIIVCVKCSALYMAAQEKLDSANGFATMFI